MSPEIENRLMEILQQLPDRQAEVLLEFAEFLLMRHGAAGEVRMPAARSATIPAPRDIPRPSEETVVKAVKRLRATYPMLDARKLLNQTAELMTQHLVQGRERTEVIEELEVLFRSHYVQLLEGNDQE